MRQKGVNLMIMKPVHGSSFIAAIGYQNNILRIKFVSGTLLEYHNVPQHIYNEFVRAGSKGRYYKSHIRGNFGGSKKIV